MVEFQVGKYTCVADEEDYAWMVLFRLKVIKQKKHPAYLTVNGAMAHRLIFTLKGEEALPGNVIDHRNRKSLDNRRCNLRQLSNLENLRDNCKRYGRYSTSKFIGVSKDTRNGLWRAQVTVNGLNTYIGLYSSEHEAAIAHDLYAIQNYRNPLRLNFPDEMYLLKETLYDRRADEGIT